MYAHMCQRALCAFTRVRNELNGSRKEQQQEEDHHQQRQQDEEQDELR